MAQPRATGPGSAYARVVDALREAGCTVDDKGDHGSASTPGHSSADRGTTFRRYPDGVLLNCHNGDVAEVLAAIGLRMADLFDKPRTTYTYPGGRKVVRYYSADDERRFSHDGNKADRTLFGADKLPADRATVVYVVEGEKDVRAAQTVGAHAVSQATGAKTSPGKADWQPLAGRPVVIVADDDEPGRERANAVAKHLGPIAASVTVAKAKDGKDLADHITAGHSVAALVTLADARPAHSVRLVAFAEIADDVPTWGWTYDGHGRIAVGTLALFAGRPGAGKSTAGRWFAAQASNGSLAGCWHGSPVNVAYIAAEESLTYVVKPSLRAAGADLTRVFFPEVQSDGKASRLTAEHVDDLARQLVAHRVRVVVVDPLMSTLGGKVDINRNNEVRELLEPWAHLADRIDGLVIGIAHLRKTGNGDVVAGINGSSAFGELARAVFGFAKDPESDAGDRIMSQEKNSMGQEDLALIYRIESQAVTTDSGSTAEVAKFSIIGTSDRTVGDVLRNPDTERDGSERAEAQAWLEDYLTENGSAPARDVKAEAKKAGISERTLKRAAQKLGVVYTSAGFPRVSHWSLPAVDQSGHPRQPVGPTRVDVAPLAPLAQLGATSANASDPVGPTAQSGQLGQPTFTGPTGENVAQFDPPGRHPDVTCDVCGYELGPIAAAAGIHPDCVDKPANEASFDFAEDGAA
ncbi:AAA family ATPase [Nocardia camponoti]|uniref:AAA family ATPase n=1 Tax=Nocardia camponoti TaxID=1616106 RepID=A0A917QFP0_9NOCA|nr:AAA family ATPase [Nocardia camponoti]GGK48392.1 hypothetical protein GCM10011591_19740 [Nocardia camponoti]